MVVQFAARFSSASIQTDPNQVENSCYLTNALPLPGYWKRPCGHLDGWDGVACLRQTGARSHNLPRTGRRQVKKLFLTVNKDILFYLSLPGFRIQHWNCNGYKFLGKSRSRSSCRFVNNRFWFIKSSRGILLLLELEQAPQSWLCTYFY